MSEAIKLRQKYPDRDLTPEHTKRNQPGLLHEEVQKAYEYVDLVLDTSDYEGVYAWHGWALREAFLAGVTHASDQRPTAEADAAEGAKFIDAGIKEILMNTRLEMISPDERTSGTLEAIQILREYSDKLRHHASDKPFHVSAGKYDDQERSYSYCNSFATLDEAIADYDKVSGYPWSEIQYKGATFRPQAD